MALPKKQSDSQKEKKIVVIFKKAPYIEGKPVIPHQRKRKMLRTLIMLYCTHDWGKLPTLLSCSESVERAHARLKPSAWKKQVSMRQHHLVPMSYHPSSTAMKTPEFKQLGLFFLFLMLYYSSKAADCLYSIFLGLFLKVWMSMCVCWCDNIRTSHIFSKYYFKLPWNVKVHLCKTSCPKRKAEL